VTVEEVQALTGCKVPTPHTAHRLPLIILWFPQNQ
jgi:hypothetical protein